MKDVTYHASAVKYNEVMAEAAEKLVDSVPHPLIKKWCASVGKQHRYHAKKHQSALDRLILEDAGQQLELELTPGETAQGAQA